MSESVRFGAFVTPSAADPDRVVGLAVLAERAGLDLVTFQDHPYQPSFLDTWTLLSFVAARTERIELAGNVLNLPLRPPAVLARSAASLDRLSRGRVALGLGAGGFAEAIGGMGGPVRSPAHAVTALDEAIRIIRALWDTDERGGVFEHGEFYSVTGAKRGPAALHAIPIWIGAYKPRMLRLVGRAADGWLPSMGYLPGIDAISESNEIIDEAATLAGRDPARISRMLNVTLDDAEPEHLAVLALDHRIDTFLLAVDDPGVLQQFASEIVPAVREILAGERPVEALEAAEPLPDTAVGVAPTPDDGVRYAATSPWRESERPTAPPPPLDATYSARGRAGARELVAVHDHLREELRQIRAVVEQVLGGERDVASARSAIAEMTVRQNDWTIGAYCSQYCRLVTAHHTYEDQGMLAVLRARDPGLAPVVDRLSAEHVVIHGVLDGVDRALVSYIADPASGAELQEALDLLTDTLLSHLSYEERELLEPLARWAAL
jgi:alkanesulfonate monooxygenase SsuD/methylene tetrahydromethanopterin reductase-like flavin-dependent oxidoreductase (luciferase family)